MMNASVLIPSAQGPGAGLPYGGSAPPWQPPNSARVQTAVRAPSTARPIIRAKGDDAPPPLAKLTIPSPEQLGIAPAPSAADTDWNIVRRRLDRLGAVFFHIERLEAGGFRFMCLLPTTQKGLTHRVDSVAATEAEAVQLALAKAEDWANKR